MHRIFVLTFILLNAQPAFADDIIVNDHNVVEAIVYNDRAALTRKAVIDIPAGSHNLVFNGLPLSIYPDSLRSKGASSAAVVFGAISHKRVSFEKYVIPKEQEINEKIIALKDTKQLMMADKTALQAGKSFIENIGKQAELRENEEIAALKLNPQEWALAADGLTTKLSQNLKASYALDIQMRSINEKIRKLQQDLGSLRTGQKQTYQAAIPYEANKAAKLTVELSYQIPNVGWTPIYDAHLDARTGAMELVQYGSVWQRTGEDWTDIQLTLSTARPNRGTGQPDLHPNWLAIIDQRKRNVQPLRTSNSFSKAANISGASAMMEMAAAPVEMDLMEEDVSIQSAQIDTNGFVSEYTIKGPASVMSDGSQSKLLVGEFETDNTLQVQIKPQYSTDAYLVVKTTLKGDAPILPGQLNLFRDGAFIGKSHLPMLRPDDVEELSFGVDDNVTVRRNVLKNEQSEAGLITKENTVTREFITEVKNLHKIPVSIAVLETIPASKDQRIRVEVLKDKTSKGYEADLHDVKGLYRWLKDIKPGQSAAVKLGWSATWPKSENISGL